MKYVETINHKPNCLYLNERRTLPSDCGEIDINIEHYSLGMMTIGYHVNSRIFEKFRTFINQSKRFYS